MSGIVTVGFVMVLSFWMAAEANRQSADHVRNLVNSAIDGISHRVSLTNVDFAYWEEAYLAVIDGDTAWVDSNIGESVSEGGVLEIAQIVTSANEAVHGYASNAGENQNRVLPVDVIQDFVDALGRLPVEPEVSVTGLTRIDGQHYFLAASHMFPYEPELMADGLPPILISGLLFSDERLTEISSEYLVEGLRLIPTSEAVPTGFDDRLLTNAGDMAVSDLIWQQPRPGNTLLSAALPAIGTMSILLSALLFYVARTSYGMAEEIVIEGKIARSSAQTDALTQLLNRSGLAEKVKQGRVLNAFKQGEAAVVYLDLNDFKNINDDLGHDAGDQALLVLAQRLRASVRPDDYIARLGGDEFVCLLLGPSPETAAHGFCNRIIKQMANPVDLDGKFQIVRASVGVSVATPGSSWELQLAQSDVAMYHAKRTGGQKPVFFSKDLQEAHDWEKSVEERLRSGIEDVTDGRSPFKLQFQPIVIGQSGAMVYAEALLRWNDLSLGAVSPDAFIPVAEAKGLLPDIGAYVLTECCQRIKANPNLTLSLNISPLQLIEDGFTDRVLKITKSAGVTPRNLIFEITESALIEVPETARERIDTLRSHGFRFALDDFGTGYASITHLKHFAFDTLKIDHSYIADIENSTHARAMLSTVVQLGNALGMDVVAEGVETQSQSALVAQAGCHLHQGFFHAKPMSFEDLLEYPETFNETPASKRQSGE
ncbi:MAG: putative bifunctional diguanylate cyclase/phosphodiesterase [Roseobacter sp.]